MSAEGVEEVIRSADSTTPWTVGGSRRGTLCRAGRHHPEPPAGSVPITVVKIDNVRSARPQTGLDIADVVYVEPVEGGYTRLAVVYSSELPDVAGPVRSARETDVELLAQYGNPSLVFSGAAPEIEPVLAESEVRLVRHSDYPDAFYRGALGQALVDDMAASNDLGRSRSGECRHGGRAAGGHRRERRGARCGRCPVARRADRRYGTGDGPP